MASTTATDYNWLQGLIQHDKHEVIAVSPNAHLELTGWCDRERMTGCAPEGASLLLLRAPRLPGNMEHANFAKA